MISLINTINRGTYMDSVVLLIYADQCELHSRIYSLIHKSSLFLRSGKSQRLDCRYVFLLWRRCALKKDIRNSNWNLSHAQHIITGVFFDNWTE